MDYFNINAPKYKCLICGDLKSTRIDYKMNSNGLIDKTEENQILYPCQFCSFKVRAEIEPILKIVDHYTDNEADYPKEFIVSEKIKANNLVKQIFNKHFKK